MEKLNSNFIIEQAEKLNGLKHQKFLLKEAIAYFIFAYNLTGDKSSSENVIENVVMAMNDIPKEKVMPSLNGLSLEELSRNSWRLNYIEVLAFAILIFNNSIFHDYKVTKESIKNDLLFYKEQGTMLNIYEAIQNRYFVNLATYSYELF